MDKILKKQNIIYIAPSLSSFVKNDIDILSKKYNVITNIYNWNNKKLTPFYLLLQLFQILKYSFSLKSIIVSSGGYWAFIPSLLGQIFRFRVFIILNGSDCASIPSINYGSLRKFPLKQFIKLSYKMATALLPVSTSLIYTTNNFLPNNQYAIQGYKYFFPNIDTKAIVVHNGIDGDFWKPTDGISKIEKTFISVFSGSKQFNLKGGDLIVKVAKKFPTCSFYLAGLEKPDSIKDNKNVFFLGRLSPIQLKEYFSKCKFYLQLSTFEGFGMALSEAMLCKCIPIGSSANIIPRIIGNSGFILNKKDLSELENLINIVLLNKNNKLGNIARNQILNNYSIDKREQKLISIIENKI